MNQQHYIAMTGVTLVGNTSAALMSGTIGVELSAEEIGQVHGGAIANVSEYIPLSKSHPKVERDMPRVPYR